MIIEKEITKEVHSALKLHDAYVDDAAYDGKGVPLDEHETDSDNFPCRFKCEITFPGELSAIVKLGCEITTPITNKYLRLTICGKFSFGQTLADDKDKLESIMKINAVSILFPYLRANVSNFSHMTDMKLFRIPLINVSNLFKKTSSNNP